MQIFLRILFSYCQYAFYIYIRYFFRFQLASLFIFIEYLPPFPFLSTEYWQTCRVKTKCPIGSSLLCTVSKAESRKNPAVSGFGALTSLTEFRTGAEMLLEFVLVTPLVFSKRAPGGSSPSEKKKKNELELQKKYVSGIAGLQLETFYVQIK